VVVAAALSHPPERLPAIVAPVLDDNYDVAIGSRCVPSGSTKGWPLHRQWLSLSRIGGWLARPLCDVGDAPSGFFAFRRELASTIAKHAHGYKIFIELLMAWQVKLKVVEVPICFRDRTHGTSKLSFSHQWIYLQRLMKLVGGFATTGTASRFAAVELFGVIIDAGLFQLLMSSGTGLALAQFVRRYYQLIHENLLIKSLNNRKFIPILFFGHVYFIFHNPKFISISSQIP